MFQLTVCNRDTLLPAMSSVPLWAPMIFSLVPFGNVLFVMRAFPPLSVTVPSVVPSTVNVTVPVTCTVGLVTCAVNVTA
jgi:hypothetical protein